MERDSTIKKSIYSDGITKRGDPNSYQDRLRTYAREPHPWPLARPSPEELAKAGFIYTGQATQVNCPTCDIYVEDWSDPRIDPVRKHYIYNRSCGFLLRHCAQRVHDIYISSRYSDASLRLNSFANWPPSAPVRPSDLASAGFYYTGEGIKTRCFSCTAVYVDWKPADIPVLIHRRLNPTCEFMGELLSDKTHLEQDAAVSLPDYSSEEVRLRSFKHWRNDVVSASELAAAGLYLVELPDVVRCYVCDVELRDWAPGETAMGKHERRNPHCPFVRQRQLVEPTSKCSISIDTSSLSNAGPCEQQRLKPLYEGSLFPPEQQQPRRRSHETIYLPPSCGGQTISVSPSYARSTSYPMQAHNPSLPPRSSIVCTEDTDSPSPRWMLYAGVDIRLPPSLDVRHSRPGASYTVEPPKPLPRSMVTHPHTPPHPLPTMVTHPHTHTPPSPHHGNMSTLFPPSPIPLNFLVFFLHTASPHTHTHTVFFHTHTHIHCFSPHIHTSLSTHHRRNQFPFLLHQHPPSSSHHLPSLLLPHPQLTATLLHNTPQHGHHHHHHHHWHLCPAVSTATALAMMTQSCARSVSKSPLAWYSYHVVMSVHASHVQARSLIVRCAGHQ